MIKVIAFDLFGTVFDLSGVTREEVRDYVKQLRFPEWMPLNLPTSWEELPAFKDSAQGIAMLRHSHIVVTCSNAPVSLQIELCRRSGIAFDALIPLELAKVYKTDPRAYMTICDVTGVDPTEVMMVTANRDFGDLEASAALGMEPMLIRGESPIKDIPYLAHGVLAT